LAHNDTGPTLSGSGAHCQGCGTDDIVNDVGEDTVRCPQCGGPLLVAASNRQNARYHVQPRSRSPHGHGWAVKAGIWVIHLLATEIHRDDMIGDLFERYSMNALALGLRRARFLLLREVAASIFPLIRKRLLGLASAPARSPVSYDTLTELFAAYGRVKPVLFSLGLVLVLGLSFWAALVTRSIALAMSGSTQRSVETLETLETLTVEAKALGTVAQQTKLMGLAASQAAQSLEVVATEGTLALNLAQYEMSLTEVSLDVVALKLDIVGFGTDKWKSLEDLEQRQIRLQSATRRLRVLSANIDRLAKTLAVSQHGRETVQLLRKTNELKSAAARLGTAATQLHAGLCSLRRELLARASPRLDGPNRPLTGGIPMVSGDAGPSPKDHAGPN
jgi:hypothetical protein